MKWTRTETHQQSQRLEVLRQSANGIDATGHHVHRAFLASVPPRPSLDGLCTDELLQLLAMDGAEFNTKVDALRALARREPAVGLIPLLPSLGNGHRPLPFLRRPVDRLGALAAPAARTWAVDEREWLARLGKDVLADHPGPEALPGLIAELADQWETDT
ncbi:hypothetical protein QEZ40_004707 [Streptomyces katrae]|uniref:Uncharacterized protein n=1 Tax=Streptomyces katrae TaxID=68223 RepID=A0ABT7H0V0_9ACTN|nr:hypothetical protein [Streptomyces katrae]MDK9499288.1 hypothetical protein [Streptomyces katrae]